MSDEELLKQAEDKLSRIDPNKPASWSAQLTQESIAASLLVIARNSVPITVEAQDQPFTPLEVGRLKNFLRTGA